MRNNDILRRLRFALDISNNKMVEIFALGGYEVDHEKLLNFLKKEEEDGVVSLRDKWMGQFLDGFIIYKRGKKEGAEDEAPRKPAETISNNDIFRKIKIALNLQSEDILDILKLADLEISKGELSAIFRRPDHKNYRECGDKYLRNFLKGLTIKYRGEDL